MMQQNIDLPNHNNFLTKFMIEFKLIPAFTLPCISQGLTPACVTTRTIRPHCNSLDVRNAALHRF